MQELSDSSGRELLADDIWQAFETRYHLKGQGRFRLIDFQESQSPKQQDERIFAGKIRIDGEEQSVSGRGNSALSLRLHRRWNPRWAGHWILSIIANTPLAMAQALALPPMSNAVLVMVRYSSA